MENNLIVKARNILDGSLKFPLLKQNDIGVQIGFDLSSPNLTTDLIVMARRVGLGGKVIGIDPDPANHEAITRVIAKHNLPIQLVQKGTYSESTNEKLILARRSSWNILPQYHDDEKQTDKRTVEVELDTVDNILDNLGVPLDKVKHINITNNGAEYATLKGMKHILSSAQNISITVISGRQGKIGQVGEKRDVDAVTELLRDHGFTTKFYRSTQLLWWGIVHQVLLKRKWPFNKPAFGVIMAHKGSAKQKWYQSYS